jgi:hypothetical protein
MNLCCAETDRSRTDILIVLSLQSILFIRRTQFVLHILTYTFSRLPEKDPLLHWLAQYASWRLEELRQMPTRFDDLLSDDDSNFAKMLVRYVSKSTVNPFNLNDDEEVVPRCPMPTANVCYDPWRRR